MPKTLFIILVLLIVSCVNKRAIQQVPKNNSNENSKNGIFTSPSDDYTIDLGEKWKLTYKGSPDSSDIVISTHVIDIDNIQMLRIYRNDNNNSSLDSKMNEEISRIEKFNSELQMSAVSKINYLENEALMIEYEYHNDSDKIERVFVMEAENGNYYVFEILSSKNMNYIENLNELEGLIKTFKTK